MKIKETNWGWKPTGGSVYFKLDKDRCLNLKAGIRMASRLKYNETGLSLSVKYFTLPKEFVTNDPT